MTCASGAASPGREGPIPAGRLRRINRRIRPARAMTHPRRTFTRANGRRPFCVALMTHTRGFPVGGYMLIYQVVITVVLAALLLNTIINLRLLRAPKISVSLDEMDKAPLVSIL